MFRNKMILHSQISKIAKLNLILPYKYLSIETQFWCLILHLKP